ncbi:MAG: hypothetical protein IK020_12960 [Clostridiales bacterium]|nr:hypothetical protein [Clostridiales bacterium]
MNEKDPNGTLPQAPVLSPETLTPNHLEPPIPPESLPPEVPNLMPTNHHGSKILIGSIAVLLLIGAVTLGVLAKSGAFSKEKAESTTSETTETSESEETTTTEPATETTGPHLSIVSLSQVTDKQFEFMDQYARDYIRLDGDGMPDEVEIDGMYCLGMLRQNVVYTGDSETQHDMVQMVYQVQVTDNTGEKPVKRQFFWMYGFANVYRDGTIDPTTTEPMWYIICFDNWTTRGSLSLNRLVDHAEHMYNVLENGIDYSLVQPFDGEENTDAPLIQSIDQITPAMEKEFEKAGGECLYYSGISAGARVKDLVVDKVEYAGLAFAISYNKSMNRVYVIYKLDITDNSQSEPVQRSVYWYVGLGGVYEGEIQTVLSEDKVHVPWDLADWVDDLTTIEELRECIQHQELSGWYYEDNLGEESGDTKLR